MSSRTRSDIKISNGRLVVENGKLRERVKVLEEALHHFIDEAKTFALFHGEDGSESTFAQAEQEFELAIDDASAVLAADGKKKA